ncbi:MAG: hypothetical protein H6625_10960, partial [Bdellovibrionaceae bacterium]|nr:hypothetical protein [Pseudobdellovibrionaceae bacterium]
MYFEKKEVGQTPLVLDVPRGIKDKQVTLELEGETNEFKLNSQFRWLDSGLTNLMFVTMYPFVLSVDFISGAAWEVKDVYVKFPKAAKRRTQDSVILIAPPQGVKEYWAPEIAENLQKFVSKKNPKSRVVPLTMTYSTFYAEDYDYHQRPIFSEQKELHQDFIKDLSATHIFESFYEIRGDRLYIYGELINLKTGEAEAKHNISLALNKLERFRSSLWQKRAGHLFNFIPNNIALQASNSQTNLTLLDPAYPNDLGLPIFGKPITRNDLLGKMSKVLSAVNINFLDPPTSRRNSRYEFSFVPSVIFSWDRFEFEDTAILRGVEFDNFIVGGGYGPQWSLVSNWGKTFFEIIPTLYYRELHWKSVSIKEESFNEVSLGSQTRLGHTTFINKHLNITFFVQNNNEG